MIEKSKRYAKEMKHHDVSESHKTRYFISLGTNERRHLNIVMEPYGHFNGEFSIENKIADLEFPKMFRKDIAEPQLVLNGENDVIGMSHALIEKLEMKHLVGKTLVFELEYSGHPKIYFLGLAQ